MGMSCVSSARRDDENHTKLNQPAERFRFIFITDFNHVKFFFQIVYALYQDSRFILIDHVSNIFYFILNSQIALGNSVAIKTVIWLTSSITFWILDEWWDNICMSKRDNLCVSLVTQIENRTPPPSSLHSLLFLLTTGTIKTHHHYFTVSTPMGPAQNSPTKWLPICNFSWITSIFRQHTALPVSDIIYSSVITQKPY